MYNSMSLPHVIADLKKKRFYVCEVSSVSEFCLVLVDLVTDLNKYIFIFIHFNEKTMKVCSSQKYVELASVLLASVRHSLTEARTARTFAPSP